MTKVKIFRIVHLCRLPKSGNIIKRKYDLVNIIQSGIGWTEDSLKDGKLWYFSFYDQVKVKISRCKVVEIEYVPERTNEFREYVEDGIITGSRNLKMDDLDKIYKKYGNKYDVPKMLYYTGFDCDTVITNEVRKLHKKLESKNA